MEYENLVRQVASVHANEIRADLEQTRQLLRRSVAETTALERRAALLEGLLAGVDDDDSAEAGTTLHVAMQIVLEDAPQNMLRAGELAAEITRRRLYRMRDGRPVEPQQIHARAGNYSQLFAVEGTFIKLIK